MATEKDYVLGTHDQEIERLGVQHGVWRARVMECWRGAGIGAGSKVLDVGAGPGYAAADLGELVGPGGQVFAVERSARFIEAGEGRMRERGLKNVKYLERDLMRDAIELKGMDAGWCRWVAAFVSDPGKLVRIMAGSLRPGGVAIFHEYVHYETLQAVPRRPAIDAFVQEVMASWRANGGEPDIARELPRMLRESGMRIRRATPLAFGARPGSPEWEWPKSFITTNPQRLVELGRVDGAFAAAVLKDFAEAEADPATVIVTPLVLEIVAERV